LGASVTSQQRVDAVGAIDADERCAPQAADPWEKEELAVRRHQPNDLDDCPHLAYVTITDAFGREH
jgi:hypothetical protein